MTKMNAAEEEGAMAGIRPAPGGLMLGIDVGGSSIKIGLVDRRGRIVLEEPRIKTREPKDEEIDVNVLVERIVRFAEPLVHDGQSRFGHDAIRGVGVVVPGILDEDRGVVLRALQVRFAGEPLTERIASRLHLPVWLDHDVRAAGFAEGLWGKGAGLQDYLLVAIGTGVGAAVVLDGRPYRRPGGVGSEFGHMSVGFGAGAPVCLCSRVGCVEAYASGGGVERRYAQLASPRRKVPCEEVFSLVGVDDHATLVFGEAVEAMAVAIMNAIVLVSPELVLLGGGVADDSRYVGAIQAAVTKQHPNFLSSIQREPPPIERAKYGRKAGTVGAAASAWLRSGVTRRELTGSH